MRADIKLALKQFQIKTWGNRGRIKSVQLEILPEEIVHYIAPTNIVIRKKESADVVRRPGILLITNFRVLFYNRISNEIFKEEFPLLEIQGVSADAGWFTSYVSFLTHTKTIDFLVHYKKERYQAIVRVLNEAIKTAVNHYNDNTLVYNPDDTVTVVTCAGCGATNILQKSTIKPCTYCGRSLSSE